jgi:hypothetical protein
MLLVQFHNPLGFELILPFSQAGAVLFRTVFLFR